jgi:hypothetical protein
LNSKIDKLLNWPSNHPVWPLCGTIKEELVAQLPAPKTGHDRAINRQFGQTQSRRGTHNGTE